MIEQTITSWTLMRQKSNSRGSLVTRGTCESFLSDGIRPKINFGALSCLVKAVAIYRLRNTTRTCIMHYMRPRMRLLSSPKRSVSMPRSRTRRIDRSSEPTRHANRGMSIQIQRGLKSWREFAIESGKGNKFWRPVVVHIANMLRAL